MIIAAASLMVILGLGHSILGERYILVRLFRRPLPPLFRSEADTKRGFRLAWHVTSVAWWGFAALLLAGLGSRQASLRIVGVTFAVSAAVSFVVSRGRHFSWGILLAIAVLTWWSAA